MPDVNGEACHMRFTEEGEISEVKKYQKLDEISLNPTYPWFQL